MKNKTINNLLIMLLFSLFAFTNVMSQVDSSFTYQGELMDNGAPANGQYDINLDLIDGDMTPWGNTSEHSPVEVVNGLFSVNADFDIDAFDGYKNFTVTVSVRKTSEGPGGAFTVLGSQTVQAVPLATNLTNGSATTGQVLTFNGFQWNPADPVAGESSPWTENGTSVSYDGTAIVGRGSTANVFNSEGLLSIGELNDKRINIDSDDIQSRFSESSSPSSLYINYYGGIVTLSAPGYTTTVRGPLIANGSVQANSGITADDSGTADMKAYVYGRAISTGAKVTAQSSDGFTVSKTSTGLYRINFTDTTINTDYLVNSSTNSSSPKFTTTVIGTDGFDLHVWDTNGNHSDHSFQFVVYRK